MGQVMPRLPAGVEYVDAAYVTRRLEAAGTTLMCLPANGTAPAALKAAWPEIVRSALEISTFPDGHPRPPRPSAQAITAMDEAFTWLALLGNGAVQTKRLLWMRLMIWPMSDKHLFSWRKIAKSTGLHRDVLTLRHARGIDRIVTRLNCQDWKPLPGSDLP